MPDERPYGIVRTITMLRSGIICFWTLQAIYTNWERRLAVRASNERPYRFLTKQKCIRALFGHLMHFFYLTVFSNYGRWYTTNLNFPFSIFNFQLKNNARAIMFELSQTVFTNRAQRHAAGDSPLFKCFHTLLECFDYIPCLIVCES